MINKRKKSFCKKGKSKLRNLKGCRKTFMIFKKIFGMEFTYKWFWCVSVLLTTYNCLQLPLLEKVTMVMNSMDNCYKKQGTIAMHYVNHSVVNLGHGKTGFNGVLVVGDNAGPLTLVKVVLYRCKARQSTQADCEYFLTTTFKDACKFFASDDDLWTPYMNASIPRMTCEGKKGNYVYSNAWMDFTKAAQLSVFFQHYWRMRLDVFSGKKIVYCHLLDFEMVTLSRKNRKN